MIDSGSGINLIKRRFINSEIILNDSNIVPLQEISSETILPLGSVTVTLLGQPTEFQVISDSINFPQDGILGNAFFKERAVIIDFKNAYDTKTQIFPL